MYEDNSEQHGLIMRFSSAKPNNSLLLSYFALCFFLGLSFAVLYFHGISVGIPRNNMHAIPWPKLLLYQHELITRLSHPCIIMDRRRDVQLSTVLQCCCFDLCPVQNEATPAGSNSRASLSFALNADSMI